MIHGFYVKHGNLNEILSMGYWRFLSILKTAHKINQIESGHPYIEEGALPESTKDMIAKRKAQR